MNTEAKKFDAALDENAYNNIRYAYKPLIYT